jgi:hypothetical protein
MQLIQLKLKVNSIILDLIPLNLLKKKENKINLIKIHQVQLNIM